MYRKIKKPLYVLPHEIEVISEYSPTDVNPYWRVRVRPHPFFNSKITGGAISVRRSRVIITSILGRPLNKSEHVHHKNEDRGDDSPGNLEIQNPSQHNKHHHIGIKHTPEAKKKIGESVSKAYQEGRMNIRYLRGSEQSQAKLDDEKVRIIRSSNDSYSSLAREYGVSWPTIQKVKTHKRWRHVT